MRRVLFGFVAAGAMLAQQGAALATCPSPSDQSAFEIEALKSEMMVLATGCHDDEQYNDFIRHYQSDLQRGEHRIDAYFRRTYGSHGQQQHDAYVTSLANAESDLGLAMGSDFCSRNAALFSEAMALPRTSDLPAYAAGKNIVPATLGTCAAPPTAPVRRVVARHYVTKKR
jgi:hypothetical protein